MAVAAFATRRPVGHVYTNQKHFSCGYVCQSKSNSFVFLSFYQTKPNSTSTRRQTACPQQRSVVSLRHAEDGVGRPTAPTDQGAEKQEKQNIVDLTL